MNRDGLRTLVAIVVIAAMVLLAVGAVGATLLEGAADPSNAVGVTWAIDHETADVAGRDPAADGAGRITTGEAPRPRGPSG